MLKTIAAATAVMLVATTSPALAQDSAAAAAPATPTAQETTQAPAAGAVSAPTSYRLVSVGGKALPVKVDGGPICREEVGSATLTLRPDGTWQLESAGREICAGRSKNEADFDHGRYTMSGGTIRFFDDDGEPETDDGDRDIDLDELSTGSLASDGTLTVMLADGRTKLVFQP